MSLILPQLSNLENVAGLMDVYESVFNTDTSWYVQGELKKIFFLLAISQGI